MTDFSPAERSGLPQDSLYGRFAVAENALVLPMQTRTAEIYVLEESWNDGKDES